MSSEPKVIEYLRTPSVAARFAAKTDRSGPTIRSELGPCWQWTAAKSRAGYGQLRIGGRVSVYAHRISWELHHGPIGDGLCVLHRCDNPPCVNPSHLFLGDRSVNNRDCAAKGRHAKTTSRRGVKRDPRHVARGERSGTAKLTEIAVREIRTAAANGTARSVLAKRFGVTHTLIGMVVTLKVWRHVQ